MIMWKYLNIDRSCSQWHALGDDSDCIKAVSEVRAVRFTVRGEYDYDLEDINQRRKIKTRNW